MSTAQALYSTYYAPRGASPAGAEQTTPVAGATANSEVAEQSGTHAPVPEPPRALSGFPHSVDLDTLAELLSSVPKPGTLRGAARVGQLIVRYYYNSDHELTRSRRRKPTSIRKLAAHARLNMSPTSLSRAVHIYQLSQRMPQLLGFTHIGVGHVSSCFVLDEMSQTALLERAERDRWTRKRLNEFILSLPPEQKPFRRGS